MLTLAGPVRVLLVADAAHKRDFSPWCYLSLFQVKGAASLVTRGKYVRVSLETGNSSNAKCCKLADTKASKR